MPPGPQHGLPAGDTSRHAVGILRANAGCDAFAGNLPRHKQLLGYPIQETGASLTAPPKTV
eukprot:11169471-Lingulodinium_polyedra.AAC.1